MFASQEIGTSVYCGMLTLEEPARHYCSPLPMHTFPCRWSRSCVRLPICNRHIRTSVNTVLPPTPVSLLVSPVLPLCTIWLPSYCEGLPLRTFVSLRAVIRVEVLYPPRRRERILSQGVSLEPHPCLLQGM